MPINGNSTDLVGVRAAARAVGINASTLSRYLKNHPELNLGSEALPKVDIVALRLHREQNVNPALRGLKAARLLAGGDRPAPAAPGAPSAAKKPGDRPDYALAKAVRETVLAQRARVDLDQKRGLLVSRREVEDAVYDAGARLQRDLLALGSQLAERLANMADKQEIETLLTTEYRQVLAALASSLRADADAAAEDQARPRCEIGPLDPRRPK